jgi:hypothetical protein
MKSTHTTILETPLNIQDFSIRPYAEAMMYPQKCFRRRVLSVVMSCGLPRISE